MNDILEVRHLVKRFGDVTAVDDLSFRVREGELFAFLGVNGAGKSTTIHILCGQLARDGGSVISAVAVSQTAPVCRDETAPSPENGSATGSIGSSGKRASWSWMT